MVPISGKPFEFHIQAKDAQGNIFTGHDDKFVVSIQGCLLTNCVLSKAYLGLGLYKVRAHVQAARAHTLVASFDGSPIQGSGFPLSAVSAETSASATVVTGTGLASGTAGVLGSVTVDARDVHNNRVLNDTDKFYWYLSGNEASYSGIASPRAGALGLYDISYNATVSGSYVLTIFYKGSSVLLPSTPNVIYIAAGSVSARRSYTVSDQGWSGEAGVPRQVVFYAVDAYGNLRTGVDVQSPDTVVATMAPVSSSSASGTTTFTGSNLGDSGKYAINVVSTNATTYQISYTINGAAVESKDRFGVAPSSASPAMSTIAESEGGKTLPNVMCGTRRKVLLQSRDQYGNPLVSPTSGFTTVASHGEIVTIDYVGGGRYEIEYASTTVGLHAINIALGSAAVGRSPYSFVATPAPTAAQKSELVGTAPMRANPVAVVAGAPQAFEIVGKDVYGNVNDGASGSSDVFSLWLVSDRMYGPFNTAPTGAGGRHAGSFNVERSGTYSISIVFNSTNAPIKLPSSTGYLAIVSPSVASPLTSSAVGSGLTAARAGIESSFNVYLRDTYGNPLQAMDSTVAVQFKKSGVVQHSSFPSVGVKRVSGDAYEISYTAITAGSFDVFVSVSSGEIARSTLVVGPGLASASKTFVVNYSAPIEVVAGQVAEVFVQSADAYGNLLHDFDNTAAITVAKTSNLAQAGWDVSVTYALAGRYRVSFVVERKVENSPYEFDILLGGIKIKTCETSPIRLTVTGSDTHAGRCDVACASALLHTFHGLGAGTGSTGFSSSSCALTGMVAGEKAYLTITSRDEYGNLVDNVGDTFTCELIGRSVGSRVSGVVSKTAGGTYTASFSPIIAGEYSIHVYHSGAAVPINGKLFHSVIVAPARLASNETSTVAGGGTDGGVAGTELSFTIVSRDRFGNARNEAECSTCPQFRAELQGCDGQPCPPVSCAFSAPLLSSSLSSSYVCSFTPTVATSQMRLLVFLGALDQVSSTFMPIITPASTSAPNSYVDSSFVSRLVAGESESFKIYTRDVFNNRRTVGGDDISLQFAGAGGGISSARM